MVGELKLRAFAAAREVVDMEALEVGDDDGSGYFARWQCLRVGAGLLVGYVEVLAAIT